MVYGGQGTKPAPKVIVRETKNKHLTTRLNSS